MKQKALLLAALLLAVGTLQVAWGQEFGQHLNLKGKNAVYVLSDLPLFVIGLNKTSDKPPGFDREAVGEKLVSGLKGTLRLFGIPFREVTSTAGADADLAIFFHILPIEIGGTVEGYAINGELIVSDWTSYRYPVRIWTTTLLWVTPSKTARELELDLIEMLGYMAGRLVIDWIKANR